MCTDTSVPSDVLFENPFSIEDVQVFDDETIQMMLTHHSYGLTIERLAQALHGATHSLQQYIERHLPERQRADFREQLSRPTRKEEVDQARSSVLTSLFWELVYWKTPEYYEELTEGERLHPGIFQQIGPDIAGKTVLDAGAGSGRSSVECVRVGATRVHAVEPSPGLLRILRRKLSSSVQKGRIFPEQGRFEALPLADRSVDSVVSCSAFTADENQGGETGLAELLRVTRPGGKIFIIWPRREDSDWFKAHGFSYVSFPVEEEMYVYFRSLETAFHCARLFYGKNAAVTRYLQETQRPQVPFSVIGTNPPRDYYWLEVAERK